jgi:hypothetical protein
MEKPMLPPPDYLNAIGLLNRREIEARLLTPLLAAMSAELGRERALEMIRKVIHDLAYQGGVQLANSMEHNDLEHFTVVHEGWKKDNAIQTEVLEQTNRKFAFNVYRCRYVEMYEHLGVRELGTVFSCERDFALIEGFNPKIKLTRTQTIMEGADICDFCFEQEEGN